MDAVFVRLLVQEVKHVLDGQRQSTSPVGRAEDGLKQVVNKLLQRALLGGGGGRGGGRRRGGRRRGGGEEEERL